jgi:hypothetical protein
MAVRDASGRITEVTFNMIDMHDRKFGSTSSFLVSPKSIRKLHDLYGEELALGARTPIDLYIWQRAMQKVLKVGCLFPFVTSVRLEHSLETTIAGRYDQLSIFASTIARNSFFVDRDLGALCEHIEKFLPLPADIHLQILMRILGFTFTDKFVDF